MRELWPPRRSPVPPAKCVFPTRVRTLARSKSEDPRKKTAERIRSARARPVPWAGGDAVRGQQLLPLAVGQHTWPCHRAPAP
jgi:hypothetical protein